MDELKFIETQFEPVSEADNVTVASSPSLSSSFGFSRTSSAGSVEILTSSSAQNTALTTRMHEDERQNQESA